MISLAGLIICFGLLNLLVALGQEGPDINYFLLVPATIGGVFSMLSLVFGLVGIIGQRERSVLVFIATLIGLLIMVFSLGEVIFPH